MLHAKKHLLRAAAAVSAVVLALCGIILPKAFASQEYFLATGSKMLVTEETDRTVTVKVSAKQAMSLKSFSAELSTKEDDETEYLKLKEIEYSNNFEQDSVTDSVADGEFAWATDDENVDFSADDVILTLSYDVADGATVGVYNLPLTFSATLDTDTVLSNEKLEASVEIEAEQKEALSITSATVADKTYDGTINATVTEITLSESSLEEGTDYTVAAEFASKDANDAAAATVTVTLSEEAADIYETPAVYNTTAKINKFTLSDDNVTLTPSSFTFSGDENVPTVTVTAELTAGSETTLEQNVDYIANLPSAANTVNAGSYTVMVIGNGNYAGGSSKNYDVHQYELTSSDIELEYQEVRVDGTAKEPAVTVKIGDYTVPSSQYTVAYANNTEVGKATVTVTAIDGSEANIHGSVAVNFEIVDKETLEISGIEAQSVVYTGKSVVLAGILTVGENEDGITASDLTETWYAADGTTEITQPVNVGSYKVEYSFENANYVGSLVVSFDIVKADSPKPAEASEEYVAVVGTTLADLSDSWTTGFAWDNPTTQISAGDHTYAATYTYNGDTDNYNPLSLDIPVYGVIEINIDASVDGTGGAIVAPDTALENETIEIELIPDDGYELNKVLVNGFNITNQVKNNVLTLTAAQTDMTVLASFRKVYTVIEGDGEDYVVDEGETATFRIDADFALFSNGGEVYVDGRLIGSGYYTATSGSTVITLSNAFLSTLSDGQHELLVAFADGGVARASFITSGNSSSSPAKTPDTGRFTGSKSGASVAGIATVAVIAMAGAAFLLSKKLNHKKVDFKKHI